MIPDKVADILLKGLSALEGIEEEDEDEARDIELAEEWILKHRRHQIPLLVYDGLNAETGLVPVTGKRPV